MNDTPSSFSIAHYILLFIVSCLCTISVVWILVTANYQEAKTNDKTIIQNTKAPKSCQRDTSDKITATWQHSPQDIPKEYLLIENNYANRIVSVRTTGTCNGQRFTCEMGMNRATCDPCANNSARKRAMFQHISDAIDTICKNK